MINTLGIIWLIGWAALTIVAVTSALVKKSRGTLTDDDVFTLGWQPLAFMLWPLLVVSLVLTAITLFAVNVWEARVND